VVIRNNSSSGKPVFGFGGSVGSCGHFIFLMELVLEICHVDIAIRLQRFIIWFDILLEKLFSFTESCHISLECVGYALLFSCGKERFKEIP